MEENDAGNERDRIFSEWLEGHKGVFFKVVHAYARTHADREDLFQEIALQVWHSVDAFRGESAVVTWVYRVALNTAIRTTLAVREAVRQGAGLSVMPDHAVADDLEAGRLLQVLPQWSLPAGGIHAVFPSARFRPAKVRAFVEVLSGEEKQRYSTKAPRL